jgi:hypothetical protein
VKNGTTAAAAEQIRAGERAREILQPFRVRAVQECCVIAEDIQAEAVG